MISTNVLQNMIVKYTDTGNVIGDYIINFIILSIITGITSIFQNSKNINYIIKKIIKFFYIKKYAEINLESQSYVYERFHTKKTLIQYSQIFKAIVFHIKDIKPSDIYSKREPDRNEKDLSLDFDIFIPDQDKYFTLDDKKGIRCIMNFEKIQNEKDGNSQQDAKIHNLTIFSDNPKTTLIELEEYIQNCLYKYNEYINYISSNEQYYFCVKYIADDSIEYSEKIFRTNRRFNTIFFEEKNEFVKSLDFFLNNKDWYTSKGIPYHYGILLHGSPGCGKTSIIKSILEHTKRSAVVIPLNRIKKCGDLEQIFFDEYINNKNIPTNKRIYIFEDIDCICDIIKSRDEDFDIIKENKKKENKIQSELNILSNIVNNISERKINDVDDELNLSFILNIFDGILETPGRMIILTTNYPERIDSALLRPGRIDINIELKKCSIKIIYDILSSFYSIDESVIQELSKNEFKDYVISPAEVMNICQKNMFNYEKAIQIIVSRMIKK